MSLAGPGLGTGARTVALELLKIEEPRSKRAFDFVLHRSRWR